jgi:hypothetical protein
LLSWQNPGKTRTIRAFPILAAGEKHAATARVPESGRKSAFSSLMKTRIHNLWRQLKPALPVLVFVAGFTWDAIRLGRRVRIQDFWLMGGYLLLAALLLGWLAKERWQGREAVEKPANLAAWRREGWPWLRFHGPYLTLQFLYGSLFSALCILYFKSSGHWGSIGLSLGIGALLVTNEFLGKQYRLRLTLAWAFLGLNCMLLLNFILPHAVNSLHPFWFYLSTMLGVALVTLLYWFGGRGSGRILPVWIIAVLLTGAYHLDLIPPVPLVKRAMYAGLDFQRSDGSYNLMVETPSRWAIWRSPGDVVHFRPGERVYCLSAVFAPKGLGTTLSHRWERRIGPGQWVKVQENSFNVTGGRENGFRGYSYKLMTEPGNWRVLLLSEGGRVLAIHEFLAIDGEADPEQLARIGL